MNHIISLSSAKHIVQKIPVTKTNRSAFTHLALCWHQCADLKFRQTLDNNERQQFWSSRHITRLIAKSLRSRSHKKRFSSMYVTFDPNTKTIHAIALTKQHTLKTTIGDTLGKYLQIGLIATNPINIRALCNLKESNRIKGAASSLIRNLHGSCSSKKYDGLYLEAIESSIKFYKKIGFNSYDPTTIRMQQKRTVPMILPIVTP